MTCRLYRHFDAQGRLLYVGISVNVAYRLMQHMQGSPWADEIRSITVEIFETREAAMKAEREAVARENPLHNTIRFKQGRARLPFPPEFDKAHYDQSGEPNLQARLEDAEGVKHTFHFFGDHSGMIYITPQGKKRVALDNKTLSAMTDLTEKAKGWLQLYKELRPDYGANDFEL